MNSPQTKEISVPFSGSGSAPKYGVILLAAGASSRMGKPKQLLEYQGFPLIVRAVNAALASSAWPIVVVLGADAPLIRPLLARLPVLVVENPRWPEGMASSLQTGLTQLDRFSLSLDGALISVVDQPHFSATVIAKLIAGLTPDKTLASARYAGRLGVPALFSRRHFDELRALQGAEGARQILAAHSSQVAAVDFPELAIDLDTPADYESLLDQKPAL